MRRVAILFVLLFLSCGGSPTEPRPNKLATGTWSNGGTCLIVNETACALHAGCGHGQFNRPAVITSGAFEVEGTYRIEVGPVSIDPPPPAHFSGTINGSVLTLTVVPMGGAPMTYRLQLGEAYGCGPACV